MDFLIRFSQSHESFRIPEIQALAELENIDLKIKEYSPDSPFCTVQLSDAAAAPRLVRRAVLVHSIDELWAGPHATLPELHSHVQATTAHLWPSHSASTFKFRVDAFRATRCQAEVLALINSFSYLGFRGAISLRDPQQTFTLFEEWADISPRPGQEPRARNRPADHLGAPARVFFGRRVGQGARHLPARYDLKKRRYISTTSMDAELALVTANLAHAAPGTLFYDPFVGTGSFPVACAHFGALALGSDIDGRNIRGKKEAGEDGRRKKNGGPGSGNCLRDNFEQYGLLARLGDMFAADLTNTPVRVPHPGVRLLDGIVCDPPYGVREGLRVLGCRDPEKSPWIVEAAAKHWKEPTYIPSKKPYSFLAMLDDILMFAAETLVDDGRLSFWMPTANEEGQEVPPPEHPCLDIVSVCTQPFSKWSRKLITYKRLRDQDVDGERLRSYVPRQSEAGLSADELNGFRKSYFSRFVDDGRDVPGLKTVAD